MHQPAPTTFVLRPGVVAVAVYGVLASVWGVWRLCTFRFPPGGSGEVTRILDTRWFVTATCVHGVLLAALFGEALVVRRTGAGIRRGQAAGIALAIVLLALAQWGAVLAHAPIERH